MLWRHIHEGWNSTKKKTSGDCFLKSWEIPLSSHTLDQDAAAFVRQLQSSPSTPSIPSATQRESASASSSASAASTSTRTAPTPVRPPDSKRKRCQVCPSSKDRKTNVLCFNCKKYLCKEHTKSVTFCHTCL